MFDWLRKSFGSSKANRRGSSREQEFTHRNPPPQLPPRRSEQTVSDWHTVLGVGWHELISRDQYHAEYDRLIDELFGKFAIEDSHYDMLLESMNAIETEMNKNGGCNWKHSDYAEHLDFLREHLTTDSQFKPEQRRQIDW